MTEQLSHLLQRLESVTQKLEGMTSSSGTKAAATTGAPAPVNGQSGTSVTIAVSAYEELINGSNFTSFLETSQKIGGLVAEQVYSNIYCNISTSYLH